jgi:hypothetical protein
MQSRVDSGVSGKGAVCTCRLLTLPLYAATEERVQYLSDQLRLLHLWPPTPQLSWDILFLVLRQVGAPFKRIEFVHNYCR